VNLSKCLYFGDFVASPIAIILIATAALAGRDIEAVGLWLLTLFAGVCAWTFVEYVIHRWVYHRVPFLEKFHDAHHANPRALLGAPSFFGVGLILVAFFAPLLAVGLVPASGFASGALIGYVGYMLVHHVSHHVEPRPGTLLYQARIRHLMHHCCGKPGNYGLTTSFWDRVFSTNLERRWFGDVHGALRCPDHR
jgi:sterol desaturase/sphingolipid hydroxylase (fatty acid hydroxylase superfamily)